jgi:hypothetical protein
MLGEWNAADQDVNRNCGRREIHMDVVGNPWKAITGGTEKAPRDDIISTDLRESACRIRR